MIQIAELINHFVNGIVNMGKIIKKAQNGTVAKKTTAERLAEAKENRRKLDSITAARRAEIVRKKDSIIQRNANARGMDVSTYRTTARKESKKEDQPSCDTADPNFKSTKCGVSKAASKQSKSDWSKKKNGGKVMLKRKDGSVSQKGLWDNLRNKAAQNKKTGAKPKSPTKQMLQQERKIKSKNK